MKKLLTLGLLWFGLVAGRAHDPYEITSVAYLYSNRMELTVELEFPTALRWAGLQPKPEVAPVSLFEAALPQFRAAAGSFWDFTAANHRLTASHTNVELGWENHVRFTITYPASTNRPLRFRAAGLNTFGPEAPYGTTLTVLDMVQQKVLGQATFFAASEPLDFPPAPAPSEQTMVAVTPAPSDGTTETAAVAGPVAAPTPPANSTPPPEQGWARWGLLLLILGVGAGYWWRRK